MNEAMNVKDLDARPYVSGRPESSPVQRNRAGDETEESARLRVVDDRILISYRARAALNEIRTMQEVDLSIKALLSNLPLTVDRAHEVLDRIRTGYYQRPEVLRRMAVTLAEVLESDFD